LRLWVYGWAPDLIRSTDTTTTTHDVRASVDGWFFATPFQFKMTIRSLRRRSNINAKSIQTKREGSRLRPHGSHRTEPARWRKPWGQFLPGRLTERFAPRTPISLVLSVPSAWIGIIPDIQIVSDGTDRSGSTPLSHGHDPQSRSFSDSLEPMGENRAGVAEWQTLRT
jgi:hypothetical protein